MDGLIVRIVDASEGTFTNSDDASRIKRVQLTDENDNVSLKGYILKIYGLDRSEFLDLTTALLYENGWKRVEDSVTQLEKDEVLDFLFDDYSEEYEYIFYTEELLVKESERNKGLGKQMLDRIPTVIKDNTGIEISLMLHHAASLDAESIYTQDALCKIYEQFGFNLVPETDTLFYKHFVFEEYID